MKIIHMLSDTTQYWVNSYVNIVSDADLEKTLLENLEPIDDIAEETKSNIVKMVIDWSEWEIECDIYTIVIKNSWYNIFDAQFWDWSYTCSIVPLIEWTKSYF